MSEKNLDSLQTLLIFNLLFTGVEPKLSDAKPNLGVARRNYLRDLGLISYEKRGRAQHIVLTDAAWAWVGENLDAPVSTKSVVSAVALNGLLPKLKAYLDRTGTPLAELLVEPPTEVAVHAPTEDLPTAVRRAYLACSGGNWNQRVRIAELRRHLEAYGRVEQDACLLALQRDGHAVLYTNENPMEVGPDDIESAVNVLGEQRHIIYLQG